jgi:hypothetical protein
VTEDVLEIAEPWLHLCGPCDIGIPTVCTCPPGDVRSVILVLVQEIERLRAEKK